MGNGIRTRLLTGAVLGLLGAVVVLTSSAVGATGQESPGTSADTFTLSATCVRDGTKVRVDYTIRSWEPGKTADEVQVSYKIVGGPGSGQLPSGSFGPGHEEFGGHFLIDAPTEEGLTLILTARVTAWSPPDKSLTKHSAPLPLPVCGAETTTTTAPSTTVGGQTTTSAALGASSTTTGQQLPFTGTHSGATLLAGVGLVAGGALVLWASRTRGRNARS